MPKFLVHAKYTAEGVKGLMRDGGSKRRAAVEKAITGAGGKMETFYFSFGDSDAVIILDMPDAASAVAISLAVGASGSAACITTPLITPEDVDAATKKQVNYVRPGG